MAHIDKSLARIGGVGVGGRNPVRIMGIINVSPESFHKGSVHTSARSIRDAARHMAACGADFIDVGGMSTAPYLDTEVPDKTELQRVVRAVDAVCDACDVPVSVDTCRASVADAALEHGASIVNDVTGLKHDPAMRDVVAARRPSLILCAYGRMRAGGNGLDAVCALLEESIAIASRCHVRTSRMAVDPAIGFFRRGGTGRFHTRIRSDWVTRDVKVLGSLDRVCPGMPVLVSVSNKSFIGRLSGQDDASKRQPGTAAAEAIAVLRGASIVRTHDVESAKAAASVASAVRRSA